MKRRYRMLSFQYATFQPTLWLFIYNVQSRMCFLKKYGRLKKCSCHIWCSKTSLLLKHLRGICKNNLSSRMGGKTKTSKDSLVHMFHTYEETPNECVGTGDRVCNSWETHQRIIALPNGMYMQASMTNKTRARFIDRKHSRALGINLRRPTEKSNCKKRPSARFPQKLIFFHWTSYMISWGSFNTMEN